MILTIEQLLNLLNEELNNCVYNNTSDTNGKLTDKRWWTSDFKNLSYSWYNVNNNLPLPLPLPYIAAELYPGHPSHWKKGGKVMHFSTWAQCFNCKSCLYLVKVKFRLRFFNLRYLSQILKHLGDFPLLQCWFGYYSHLSGPKYMWLNIGEGEGHIWVRTKVRRVNAIHFQKNSRKTVSVSTICDADCRLILNFLSLLALIHE